MSDLAEKKVDALTAVLLKHSDRIATLLGYPGKAVIRRRSKHPEGGEMKTQQHLQAGTDINRILERWLKHGTSVAHLNPQEASYGDFSSGVDYATALNKIKAAEADFDALPSRVRALCGNDPAEFLQIVFDPERRDELEGLDIGYRQSVEGDTPSAPGPGDDPPDPVKVGEGPKDLSPPQGEN